MFWGSCKYKKSTLDSVNRSRQLFQSNIQKKDKVIIIKKESQIQQDIDSIKEQNSNRNLDYLFANYDILNISEDISTQSTISQHESDQKQISQSSMISKQKHITTNVECQKQDSQQQDFNLKQSKNQNSQSQNLLQTDQQLVSKKGQSIFNLQSQKTKQCTNISEYTTFQQLIITRRHQFSQYFSKQDKNRIINILSKIQGALNKQQYYHRLLKYLNCCRQRYQFKICACKEKHTILYFQNHLVPTLQQKPQLILEHYNKNKKLSSYSLANKIKQSGFKWNCMKNQIHKFIQFQKTNQIDDKSKQQLFKSHDFPFNNKAKQNKQIQKLDFQCCFSFNEYSEFEKNVIRYLDSHYQTPKDKIMNTLELKKMLQEQQQQHKSQKDQIQYYSEQFQNFKLSNCSCLRNKKLSFRGSIVPSPIQKQILIKQFYQKAKINKKQIIQQLIFKNILQEGFNWKDIKITINNSIQKIVKEQEQKQKSLSTQNAQNLIQLSKQNFLFSQSQSLKVQNTLKQCQSQISQYLHQCIQKQQEPKNKNQDQNQDQLIVNIISSSKSAQQQIVQSRNKILKDIRSAKNIPYKSHRKLKRSYFISDHKQQQ